MKKKTNHLQNQRKKLLDDDDEEEESEGDDDSEGDSGPDPEVAKVRFTELEAAWAKTKAVVEKHGRNSPEAEEAFRSFSYCVHDV